ncbi:MAG TPA: ATP-dependent DNA ligase [Candidatus Binatia bacterium]|nr:ATP-dependent DNA ligase [Candidatus Binatia bacterium]
MDTIEALAEVFRAVEGTRSRLEKRRILVEYLGALSDADLGHAVTFLLGRPFPRAEKRRISVGGATLVAALAELLPGLDPEAVSGAWRRHGDASDMAADIRAGAGAPPAEGPPVRLGELAERLAEIHVARGSSAKAVLLARLFRRMGPPGVRAAVKVLLGETRAGMQESLLEDAVARLAGQTLEAVRAANRHRADLGAVAREARRGFLDVHHFSYFTPLDPMLAHPAAGPGEAIRRLGAPVWVEDKYDGVRCQLHAADGEVRLYSRDRHEITHQFPEVVAVFARVGGRYALDAELVAMDGDRALPFARLQQRLGRLRPSPEVVAAHPAALVSFDLLALGDESLLAESLRVRRERLEALALPEGQRRAPLASARSEEELESLFAAARARGNEGLMCKQPGSPYISGRRGHHWLKLKRPLDTLDVVVVGAEWGHGKRRAVLSDYTFAVRDPASGALLTIGKAYGGLTDAEIRELTARLHALTVHDAGHYRTVRHEIVLEVAFNNVQRSSRHGSGYALRFPRIVRVRPDRTAADASTLADVERLRAVPDDPPPGKDRRG